MIYELDGTKVSFGGNDIDGDGKTGGVEILDPSKGEYNEVTPSELGESLGVLMDDQIQGDTRMSGIDMRSRLQPFQTTNLAAYDGMVSFGVIPKDCLFLSRQIKRLSCSIDGWRANQIVETVVGKREMDSGGKFSDKVKSFFGGGGE
jgi:hypothetical protein